MSQLFFSHISCHVFHHTTFIPHKSSHSSSHFTHPTHTSYRTELILDLFAFNFQVVMATREHKPGSPRAEANCLETGEMKINLRWVKSGVALTCFVAVRLLPGGLSRGIAASPCAFSLSIAVHNDMMRLASRQSACWSPLCGSGRLPLRRHSSHLFHLHNGLRPNYINGPV